MNMNHEYIIVRRTAAFMAKNMHPHVTEMRINVKTYMVHRSDGIHTFVYERQTTEKN